MSAHLKHTPGPWAYEKTSRATTNVVAELADYDTAYSIVSATPASTDDAEPDARLIAAAPDLAEALANAIEDLMAMHGARWSEYEGTAEELVGEYRAALAKAGAA